MNQGLQQAVISKYYYTICEIISMQDFFFYIFNNRFEYIHYAEDTLWSVQTSIQYLIIWLS